MAHSLITVPVCDRWDYRIIGYTVAYLEDDIRIWCNRIVDAPTMYLVECIRGQGWNQKRFFTNLMMSLPTPATPCEDHQEAGQHDPEVTSDLTQQ